MQPPVFPPDEAQRIAALLRYDILDTPDEVEFDDITQLASDICATPIGIITLLDMERQWFKSKVGLDAAQTERKISFCGHAILNDGIFEISDATQDPRFADNPLVTGDPQIRFYAGAPLITSDGFKLGTLCVIDRVPRNLSDSQRRSLQTLGRQVVRQFEVRNMARELARQSQFQAAVLNSPDLVMISTALDGRVNGFNQAAEALLGYGADSVIRQQSLEYFYEPQTLSERTVQAPALGEGARRSGFDVLISAGHAGLIGSGDWLFRRKDGSSVPVQVAITPIVDAASVPIGYLCTARDVSDLRQAESSHRSALEFIQKIAQRVPGMIYQFRQRADGSSCFPYASQGIQTIYRVDPSDVVDDASSVFARIHPEDAIQVNESIMVSSRELTPWRHEYRVRFPDNSVRWLFGNAIPERIADGSTLWHGFITDVTDQKAAALALESSEHFLQILIDHLPVGIYSKRLGKADVESGGIFRIWNRAAERMSGIRSTDVIGRANKDIFDPATARMHAEHDKVLLDTKASVTVPMYPVQLPDGKTRLLRMTSLPLFDAAGEVEYSLGIAEDITELLQQKKELRQRKAELEGVNDASPLGLFRADQSGAVTYVNRTFSTLTGLASEAALGFGWVQAMHPEDVDRVTQQWHAATVGHNRYDGTHRFLHADGRTVLVQAIAVPIVVDGVTTGFVGTIDDITERMAAAEIIAASEKRLRTITDNVPAMIGYIDADERYRFCNIHYRTVMGFDPAAMIGASLRDVYGDASYEYMRENVQAALAGRHMSFERTSLRHGGQKQLQCDYVPDIDATGQVLGFYALVTDVTARHATQQNLTATAHRLRAVTDHLPALIAHIDRDQRYLFVNAQIGQLFGKDLEAMIGKSMQQEHPPERYAVLRPHIDAVLAGHEVTFEGEAVLPGGNRFYQSNYIPDRDAQGSIQGFFAMTFDITERKHSEIRLSENEKRLRTITDNIPAIIGYIDAQQRLQFCNIHYQTMLGFDVDKILGKPLYEVFDAALYAQMAPHVATALSGRRASFEREVGTGEQKKFHQVEYVPDIAPDGRVMGFYALVTDVTARRTTERRLADSEHRLRTITDNLPVAITYIDHEQRVHFSNSTLYAWTGKLAVNVVGQSLREMVGEELYEQRREYYERALGGERVEYIKQAHSFHQDRVLQSTYIPDLAEDGSVRGIFTLSNDITALKKVEEELRRLARFDSLTGLPNRAHLYESLDAALERSKRSGMSIAVLFLDIDKFKNINDTLGHRKGDLVLQEFATRLQRAVRTTDTVARLAGDEFVIILESLKEEQEAEMVAAKILATIQKPWLLNGEKLAVTTSIGIAYDREHVNSGSELIACADASLYDAKAAGRNRFHTRCC